MNSGIGLTRVSDLSGIGTINLNNNTLQMRDGIFSGTISGMGGGINNTGVFTLSGTNSYSGPTTVASGTLTVTGTLTDSDVTVNSGATLQGPGSIVQSVTRADALKFWLR